MDEEAFLDVGSEGATIDQLITLIELQQGLLAAVAAGRPPIKRVDETYKERRKRIQRGLGSLSLEDPFPWPGLSDWHGFWRSLGGYAARRAYVEGLAAPVLDELRARRDVGSGSI